ncbi:MAG: sugar transferase [Planctomycetes bacterium]|nr:sugar transferase [Planctomycetota bacterium]
MAQSSASDIGPSDRAHGVKKGAGAAARRGTFAQRHFEELAMCGQVLLDLFLVVSACLLAWVLRERFAPVTNKVPLDYYAEAFSLTAACCLVSFRVFGLYNPIKSLLNVREFYGVTKAVVVSFILVIAGLSMLRPTNTPVDGSFEFLAAVHHRFSLRIDPAQISRSTLVLAFILIYGFMMSGRFLTFRWIQACHRRGIGHRNLLIIGAGSTGRTLQRKLLLMPTLGLNLVGFVDEDKKRVGAQVGRSRVLGDLDDLPELIDKHNVGEVIIARPDDPPEKIMAMVDHLERAGVHYSLVPRFYRLFDTGRVQVTNLDATPLISRARHRVGWTLSFGKRLVDIVISALVLILGSPLLLLIAAAIKWDSKGPALFVQTRIGRDGKPFRIAKFRTMYVASCGDEEAPSNESDPRVTRVGKWLRRYSLDEVPNFWNVFKGDMSLVGPRPEMPFIVDRYDRRHRERLLVKPGITGLWQISYARQYAIHDNLDYDIYYIENQSILLDAVILMLTVVAVVRGTGAY